MNTFIVNFRTHNDTNRDQYNALIKAVQAVAVDPVWDEGTSIFIFQAPGDENSVFAHLTSHFGLLTFPPTVLVINCSTRQFAASGVKNREALAQAMGGMSSNRLLTLLTGGATA
ncbi:MAG: hypothetical protein AB7I35_01275 [Ramlibacter sp.]